jgi:hypothetical protein
VVIWPNVNLHRLASEMVSKGVLLLSLASHTPLQKMNIPLPEKVLFALGTKPLHLFCKLGHHLGSKVPRCLGAKNKPYVRSNGGFYGAIEQCSTPGNLLQMKKNLRALATDWCRGHALLHPFEQVPIDLSNLCSSAFFFVAMGESSMATSTMSPISKYILENNSMRVFSPMKTQTCSSPSGKMSLPRRHTSFPTVPSMSAGPHSCFGSWAKFSKSHRWLGALKQRPTFEQ